MKAWTTIRLIIALIFPFAIMTSCGTFTTTEHRRPHTNTIREVPQSAAQQVSESLPTNSPSATVEQPSEILPFLEQFEKDIRKEVTTQFEFTDRDLGPSVIAICFPLGQYILVNKLQWDKDNNYMQREFIVYHELGHCMFHFRHTRTGIMRDYIMQPEEYESGRDDYIQQYLTMIEKVTNK